MEKKSLKLLPWTNKDIIGVTATYIANVILLALFYIVIIRINMGAEGFTEYFAYC